LANAESHNAELIREGLSKEERFNKLKDMVTRQLEALNNKDFMKSLKKTSQDTYLQAPKNDEDSK
jgi:hypothetical protein